MQPPHLKRRFDEFVRTPQCLFVKFTIWIACVVSDIPPNRTPRSFQLVKPLPRYVHEVSRYILIPTKSVLSGRTTSNFHSAKILCGRTAKNRKADRITEKRCGPPEIEVDYTAHVSHLFRVTPFRRQILAKDEGRHLLSAFRRGFDCEYAPVMLHQIRFQRLHLLPGDNNPENGILR